MARPVHPSHSTAHDTHSTPKPDPAKAGHGDPKSNKPGDGPARDERGFGRRAADNMSDAVESWANRRSNNPHGANGVGRAARNAVGAVTKGAQAASSPLHNQDPYHVASVTGEAMSAASSAFSLAKTHAGDLAAHAASAAFKGRKTPRPPGPGTHPAPGKADAHAKTDPHHHDAGHPAAHSGSDGSKPAFGGAKPNRNADTTARDALGTAAAQTQHAAKAGRTPPGPTRDAGPEIE